MDSETFEENLTLFAFHNPLAAIHLPETSPKSPPISQSGWLSKVPLDSCETLILFGIGLGEGYDEAKPWLSEDPKRRLIIMDDHLGIIRNFLETDGARELLADPQVEFYGFLQISGEDPAIQRVGWSVVEQEILPAAHPYYLKTRPEESREFEQVILFETSRKNSLVDEYLNYGIVFYRNFYRNLLSLPDAYHGNQLFGEFKNVPAIICGAGPSLQKNVHLLKDLSNRALIFAGGSAIKALKNEAIIPHFGAGIDPNPSQLDRIRGCPENLAFFFRPRMYDEALNEVRGPRLYLNGAGGYDTAEWFEDQLGIEGKVLDEGHNVINFCTEIAQELGCNPIIFVGMDLAYTGNQAYFSGVSDEPVQEEHEVVRSDIYGNPVGTKWKWIAESDWCSRYVEEHPELTVINATEGGIGFRGVPNMSLKEVIQNRLQGSHPIHDKIKKAIEEAAFTQITEEKVRDLMNELAKSLKQVLSHFDTLIEETEKVSEEIAGGEMPETLQTGLAVLAETELVEEAAYHAVIEVFNTLYSHIHHKKISMLKFIPDERMRKIKTAEMMKEKYRFLRRVAEANLLLLREALE